MLSNIPVEISVFESGIQCPTSVFRCAERQEILVAGAEGELAGFDLTGKCLWRDPFKDGAFELGIQWLTCRHDETFVLTFDGRLFVFRSGVRAPDLVREFDGAECVACEGNRLAIVTETSELVLFNLFTRRVELAQMMPIRSSVNRLVFHRREITLEFTFLSDDKTLRQWTVGSEVTKDLEATAIADFCSSQDRTSFITIIEDGNVGVCDLSLDDIKLKTHADIRPLGVYAMLNKVILVARKANSGQLWVLNQDWRADFVVETNDDIEINPECCTGDQGLIALGSQIVSLSDSYG